MISLWMTCLCGLPQRSFVSQRAPGVAFRTDGLHCCKTECLTQLGVRVRGHSTECWDDFSHLWASVPLGPEGSRYTLLSGAWLGDFSLCLNGNTVMNNSSVSESSTFEIFDYWLIYFKLVSTTSAGKYHLKLCGTFVITGSILESVIGLTITNLCQESEVWVLSCYELGFHYKMVDDHYKIYLMFYLNPTIYFYCSL